MLSAAHARQVQSINITYKAGPGMGNDVIYMIVRGAGERSIDVRVARSELVPDRMTARQPVSCVRVSPTPPECVHADVVQLRIAVM